MCNKNTQQVTLFTTVIYIHNTSIRSFRFPCYYCYINLLIITCQLLFNDRYTFGTSTLSMYILGGSYGSDSLSLCMSTTSGAISVFWPGLSPSSITSYRTSWLFCCIWLDICVTSSDVDKPDVSRTSVPAMTSLVLGLLFFTSEVRNCILRRKLAWN